MRRTLLLTVALAAGTTLYAADLPPLISDVRSDPNDSRLVSLAKRTVAARHGMTSVAVLNNDNLFRGRAYLAQPSGEMAPLPAYAPDPGPAPRSERALKREADEAAERAKLIEKKNALNNEQHRMAEEADQPYGGDYSEDQVERRLSKIPEEQAAIQQQLQPPPPPVQPH